MMTMESLNYILALCAIALQCAIVYLLVEHFFFRKKTIAPYIKAYALEILFVITAGASVLTLVYSEYFGVIPCGLCWLGRVFLYPLPFIFALALIRKYREKRIEEVADYGIGLSLMGLLVSSYHHMIQMGGSAFVACPTAGAGADCAKRIIFEFGYVTFPLLGATLFAFIIVLLLIYRRSA